MREKKLITASSIACMAGNIAAGFASAYNPHMMSSDTIDAIADVSVRIAKRIVTELETPAPAGSK